MSVPLAELHQAILDYLTIRSRIMFAHKVTVWGDFHTQYDYKYADYSEEDLRDEFVKTILPKVYTFELTDIQKRKIEIYADHAHFTRTTHGFREREIRRRQPVEGVDYVREENAAEFPHIACVLREPAINHSLPRPDQKIAAWTSAVNSNDAELAEFILHRGSQLHRRVEENAKRFRETGECPLNMNMAVSRKIIHFMRQADELSSKTYEEVQGEE